MDPSALRAPQHMGAPKPPAGQSIKAWPFNLAVCGQSRPSLAASPKRTGGVLKPLYSERKRVIAQVRLSQRRVTKDPEGCCFPAFTAKLAGGGEQSN